MVTKQSPLFPYLLSIIKATNTIFFNNIRINYQISVLQKKKYIYQKFIFIKVLITPLPILLIKIYQNLLITNKKLRIKQTSNRPINRLYNLFSLSMMKADLKFITFPYI